MTKLLLCTDLDRTLIPNGHQPESSAARKRFDQLVARENVTLVYVTGRDKSLILNAIKNYQLPTPDFVIADVGSTIYYLENAIWRHIEKWDAEISDDWNGKSNKELQTLLKDFPDIRLQEDSKQKVHKLSYYVPLYIEHELLVSEIYNLFINKGIKANIVWSVDEGENIGLLDILPASANKKHAIEFLMSLYRFGFNETIFSGDSGNDISVMASPIHSVLVANASEIVKKAALQTASVNNQSDSLYIAQGNFMGMNGNYSAGIIEGVVHYMPIVNDWLGETDE